jgi:hypothetical protein
MAPVVDKEVKILSSVFSAHTFSKKMGTIEALYIQLLILDSASLNLFKLKRPQIVIGEEHKNILGQQKVIRNIISVEMLFEENSFIQSQLKDRILHITQELKSIIDKLKIKDVTFLSKDELIKDLNDIETEYILK